MNILLTAATAGEIRPVTELLAAGNFECGPHRVEILISGVGSLLTTYSLTREIQRRRPDFLIQGGIAGSFRKDLCAPETVIVRDEIMADLGALENGRFYDVFDLKLIPDPAFPFRDKRLVNPLAENSLSCYGLRPVTGVTINEISTQPERIQLIREKYAADLESMEGAPLHYIALMEGIPFLQIRAISNFVGERNKQNWKMKEAIEALNHTLWRIIPQIG